MMFFRDLDRRTLGTFAAVFGAVFLGALDQTVIVTVLPAVVLDLQIPFNRLDQAAWIVSGYLLGYTVALPLMGQFADLRGRRRAFIVALCAFGLGSIACALAGSLGGLIAARILQAAGGGALLPVAVAIVADQYPATRRAVVIGLVGAVAEAGGVLGPLYGAAIVSVATWRWIFWLNVPLAAICLVLTLRGIAERPPSVGRLDLPGAFLAALALGSLILGLDHAEIAVAGFDLRPIFFVVLVIVAAAFVFRETRISHALVDFALFKSRAFAAGIAGAFLLGVALIVAMVDVPLFAATVLSLSPAEGGLLLMRMTAFIPVGAVLGGALGQRFQFALPSAGGFLIAAVGLEGMSAWGATPTGLAMWLGLGTAGFGFGLVIAPLTTAVVNSSGLARAASAASTFTVARLTGMTVGLSALTAWGLTRFDDLAGALALPLPAVGESTADYAKRFDAYNQALVGVGAEIYHEIFLATSVVCAVGIVVALLLRSSAVRDDSQSVSPTA